MLNKYKIISSLFLSFSIISALVTPVMASITGDNLNDLYNPTNSVTSSTYSGTNMDDSTNTYDDTKINKTGKYLVNFKDPEKGKKNLTNRKKSIHKNFKYTSVVSTTLTEEDMKQLQTDPNVDFVEEEKTFHKSGEVYPDGLQQIHIPEAHESGITGQGVKVAVLDTGISTTSAELHITDGASFVPSEPTYEDFNGHGTGVAGILASLKDDQGLIGAAPNVSLYAEKVLDRTGTGTTSQIIAAIEWAIDRHIDIITMSFAGTENSRALEKTINEAYRHGILLIAASGNEGTATIDYPARYDNVMAVGAVDQNKQHAAFSNTGSKLELVAPGVNVQTLALAGGYAQLSGTSVAVPQVAGVAVLIKQKNPTSTNKEIRNLLDKSADDLGDVKLYGYGLVNAYNATKENPTVQKEHKRKYNWGTETDEEIDQMIAEYSPEMLKISAYLNPYVYSLLTPEQQKQMHSLGDKEIKALIKALSKKQLNQLTGLFPAVKEFSTDYKNRLNVKIPSNKTLSNNQTFKIATTTNPITEFKNEYNYHVNTDALVDPLYHTANRQVTDLSLNQKQGLDLNLVRTYNSLDSKVLYPTYSSSDGNYSRPYDLTTNQYYIAAGWKLNIPSMQKDTVNQELKETNGGSFIQYAYQAVSSYLKIIFTLDDGATYEFRNGIAYDNPYGNIIYYACGVNYCLNKDGQIIYTFNSSGFLISKENQFGDKINYSYGMGFMTNADITITDSYNRTILISRIQKPDGNFVISGFKVTQDGQTIKQLNYVSDHQDISLNHKTSYNGVRGDRVEEVNFWRLLRVEDITAGIANAKTLESYDYYQVNALTLADFNYNLDNTWYPSDASGNPTGASSSYSWADGKLIEHPNIYNSSVNNYGEIAYLLLQHINYNNGLMVTYNYQSYFTNWASSLASGITGANIGSAEQGRHSTRLYSDPYALQYVGYHTVQRVDYSYTQNSFSGSNSMNQSEFFYNLHLDHGYQFNEYWKSTKSSIKRFNNSSRFGDRQTVEHQTPGPAFVANTYLEPQSYQYYKISTTKDYELSVAWNTDIYNLGHDALFDKTDGNTYYTNKANEVKAYQYDFKKPKTEYTFAFNMDSANPEQIWSYVNATNSTINSYTYDNWGYLATQTDSLGNSSQYTYAGPYHQISNQTTQSQDSNTKSIKEYTYYLSSDGDPNRRNQLATVKSTQNYLNPNTNQIDSDVAESDIVTYNSNKLPTQTKEWSPSGSQFSNSNVQTIRDMAYSSYGLLNTETDHVTLGLNQTASSFSTSYAYDALGRKTRITNPDNSHSDYGAYDVLDRVGTYTFTPDPALGAAARTTAIGYSDTDRKVTITTPDGEKNESIYTPYGLLYQQQQTKNGNSRIVLSNTTNDGKTVIDKLLFNSTAQKTSYDYDSMGRVSTVADAIGQVVTYTYANNAQNQSTGTNYLQNTVQAQYPDGKKEFTYYNRFNQVVKVDEIGFSKSKTTINDYSTFGKLIQSTLTSNGKSEATNYRYDTFGNLIYVKDAEGNINQYVYDRMGNLLIYKVNGVEQKRSTYNEAGWMLTTTNASGNQEQYSYKNTGLLNTYVDKMSQTYSYTYTPYFGKDRTSIKDTSNNEIDWQQNTYDPQNLLLTGQTNSANETTTYHYDQWKRMDSETVAGRLYGLGYDGFDRLQTLTYPDQQQVGYTYDNINRFTSVSFPGMGTVGYDYLVIADSNSIKLSYPNGAVPDAQSQTSVRDVFGELKQVDNYQKDQNNNLVMNFHEDFNYDGFGNIKTLHRNSSTYSFQYDLNNRIKQESNVNGQIDYTYDDRGNRLTLQNTNPLDVSMDSTTLSYNALNQLKTFSNDSGTTVSYTYYSDGLRATKMVNGTKTRYVYLNGKIIEELSLDANGNVTGVTARNIWGDSILFRKDNTSGKSGYFFSNGHGDIVRVTDVNRNVLNSYEYDIWGNVIAQSETMSNPFKYTGEVLDNESGYYYLRARYYDPSIGRFINEDTYEGDITNPLSLNLYTYVSNNPLIYTDPSGMCGFKSWGDAGDCFVKAGKGIKDGTVATIKWISKSDAEKKADMANATIVASKATYQFMIGDDVDTLSDPNATQEERTHALINLSLYVIPGAGEEAILANATTRALTKAEAKSLAKLAENVVLKDGMKIPTNKALDLAGDFLGKGYKDTGGGRFVSADGSRVVRMGDTDILGKHGGGSHMNFETLVPNPAKQGKMKVDSNLHIYLED